jgi:hypothetical protein
MQRQPATSNQNFWSVRAFSRIRILSTRQRLRDIRWIMLSGSIVFGAAAREAWSEASPARRLHKPLTKTSQHAFTGIGRASERDDQQAGLIGL